MSFPFKFEDRPVDHFPGFEGKRAKAYESGKCSTCERTINYKVDPESKVTHEGPIAFRDDLSVAEHKTSLMCQGCQDIFFPPQHLEMPEDDDTTMGPAPCGHFKPCSTYWLQGKPCHARKED